METIIAYHGTAVEPAIIRKEGLRPPDFRKVVDAVLEEFAGKRIPKWVFKSADREVNYRQSYYQGNNVHFTLSKTQASSYAGTIGGEIAGTIRRTIELALRRKRTTAYKNGKNYVVTARIPLDKRTLEVKERLEAHGYNWEKERERGGWDIKVPFVKPEDILNIEEIPNPNPNR